MKVLNQESGENWEMIHGDCVEVTKGLPSDSIDFSIFSPPFAQLYTYSDSDRDMGNTKDDDDFMEQFAFMVKELYRVMRPGRNVSFHCMNLPTSKEKNGYIGIRDFRGDMIRLFQSVGFIYHSEVVIWKDPVTAMQRTKALGLLHKQVVKDSAMSRQGIPDYLVTMRKPGENKKPIQGEFDHYVGDEEFKSNGRLSIDIWQRYASPVWEDIELTEDDVKQLKQVYDVWMDINPSDTLQYRNAKEDKDGRHICPLQLQVIHRALQLWSLPGDVVYSPFGGIASEGWESIKLGRKFVAAELKESYWVQGCKNLREAEKLATTGQLKFEE